MDGIDPGFQPAEHRQSCRISMFVAATLRDGARITPVRVRNMSAQGALIEAAVLPPVGTAVELARGSLTVHGSIAWAENGRCGLTLTGLVDTAAWMSRTPPAHQAGVDARIAEARQAIAAAPPAGPPLVEPTRGYDLSNSLPQQEIVLLVAKLEELGDALSADPTIIARHGESLQIIDEVQQRLGALSRRLH